MFDTWLRFPPPNIHLAIISRLDPLLKINSLRNNNQMIEIRMNDLSFSDDEVADLFKKLLEINGRVALGTDFPVEKVNPMLTFYAAVARKDLDDYPNDGFEMENALSREETIKGMTIWAAYANFEENEKGSIEVGKKADLVFCTLNDLRSIPFENIYSKVVYSTNSSGVNHLMIDGKWVMQNRTMSGYDINEIILCKYDCLLLYLVPTTTTFIPSMVCFRYSALFTCKPPMS